MICAVAAVNEVFIQLYKDERAKEFKRKNGKKFGHKACLEEL